MDHMGYDLEGEKIAKPTQEDKIDEYLALNENSSAWRSVYDEETGKRIVISDKEMAYIKRIQQGQGLSKYDPEHWFIELSGATTDFMPTTATPEPKRRFVPSKWEALRIRKLAYAIRKGRIKLDKDEKPKEPQFHLIWDNQEDEPARRIDHVPPPKPKLPGHEESYNPPEEYLFDEEEEEAWKNTAGEDRRINFVPQKYASMRHIPSYKQFHKERFERCLDLYLVARARRKRPPVDLSTLVSQLPKPSELKPFPSSEAFQYIGHKGQITSLSVDPTGQWLISSGSDKTVRLWEIKTTRCVKVWTLPAVVQCLEWNPSRNVSLVALSCGSDVLLLTPPVASAEQRENTDALFENFGEAKLNETLKKVIEWKIPEEQLREEGFKLRISYNKKGVVSKFLTWHGKGDYLASVYPDNAVSGIFIHQISKRQTQAPFNKTKGQVQCVRFHPSKPFFILATQKAVRVYNLLKQALTKKLSPSVQQITSLDVHPEGDNLIIGSLDRKVCWFDLDLSTKPYKTLKYHEYGVRSVRYHKRYPLFASSSDDGNVHVFHGTVYSDLLTNPLIVPLKVLRGHQVTDDLGVQDIIFHPTQPWIFSAGADSTIRLFI